MFSVSIPAQLAIYLPSFNTTGISRQLLHSPKYSSRRTVLPFKKRKLNREPVNRNVPESPLMASMMEAASKLKNEISIANLLLTERKLGCPQLLTEKLISSDSFFENKTGLPRDDLLKANFSQPHHTLLRNFQRQFLSLSSTVITINRGFKTRSGKSTIFPKFKTEVSGKNQNENKELPKMKDLLDRFNDSIHSAKDTLDQQTKNNLLFAEGYMAGSKNKQKSSWFFSHLNTMANVVIAVVLLVIALRVLGSGSVAILSSSHEINPEEIRVTFNDVKGTDEAKDELLDVVNFLRDPEKFTSLGARLPKGVLLVGPPGIGKTLLARAVAGEAGVPFFQASGSEFEEVFVGTGSKRIRQLFAAAKHRAPCVIFIDEIDSVGGKRTSSVLHPYANQTINQLLSEMDGFKQNEGVIVLGATNKVQNLDKALIRPGRFDVEVNMYAPDLKGRQEILQHYLSKVIIDENIDVEKLAHGTRGFTGADLENIVNQAALRAAMEDCHSVTTDHLEFARDKVLMGVAKKHKIPDEETNWCTAYHEAGHAIVAFFTKDTSPLHKVTIIPRGMSLGHTARIPDREIYNQTKAELLAEMDVSMGGRVGEEIVYGSDKVTTGAGSDFEQATAIARQMVSRFGMSEKVGVRVCDDSDSTSSSFQDQVDSEISRILQESYERAKSILRLHAREHTAVARALMQHETLDLNQVTAIIKGDKL